MVMIRSPWQPPVDVLRGRDHWYIRVELAGIRADQVEIKVESNAVIIRGCRRDLLPAQGFTYHSLEINYSAFERRIGLPFEIDHSRLTWQSQDGMVLIQIQPRSTLA